MNLPRREIADGVFVNCLATDKFKLCSIAVGAKIALDIENVTAANLLSRVLGRGCKKYPDIKALEKKLDETYAAELSFAVTRSGEDQYFYTYADFLSDEYTEGCDIIKETVDIIGDTLTEPLIIDGGFKESYVNGEKKNLCDDIDAVINNKAKYARNRLVEEMCRGEAYSLPMSGDKKVLEHITSESLYDFYKHMIEDSHFEILYTGPGDRFEKVCKELARVFSKLARNYTPSSSIYTSSPHSANIREVSEDMEVSQGKLAIGIRTGITNTDADIGALIVANEIFGGSPNSKLFMNVREKMSLCYYCSSNIDAVKGIMFVNAGIESQNYGVAKNAILEQFEAVKNGEFSDDDFKNAKSSLINAYKSVSDSVSSLETWYLPRIFRHEDDTPDDRIAQIEAVTKEECSAVMKRLSVDVIYFLRGTLKEEKR